MKRCARLPGRPLLRGVLASGALVLALTGGTVGAQVVGGGPTAAAPAPAVPAGTPSHAAALPAGTGGAPVPAPAAPASSTAARPTPAAGTTPVRAAGTGTAPRSTAPAGTARTSTAPAGTAPATAPRSTATASEVPTTNAPTSTAPASTAPAAAGPVTRSAASPLAGATFYGPNTGAAQAAQAGGRSAADAALLRELAQVPTTLWLGGWSGDVAETVRTTVRAAQAAGSMPVFVAYDIPGRDCGQYSAGGAGSVEAYDRWIAQVAAGIGTAEAVVVVEPDALAQLCGDTAQRYAMLDRAVSVLEANPGTHTYLDAGNPTWIPAGVMADRLRTAGVAKADGFALNVSNFETTASNLAYGRTVAAALGGAHFVVDTSRNGRGPGTHWCNPTGRAIGERPTGVTGQAGVDAYLWIKRPGESDGTCNGGPEAGTFWTDHAIGLMRNR
ncbi:glycoside hydrolase family 6 protein [Modestobacter sp. VKM Ac-2986]|uniref:glycoside hydrolase family 6 protein n=1 Tax=Modestobacter sp. VKM Ac-2986 TaxID=3004140 RepID=UPI0022ABBC3C|nr:glycoside hydrolase family 6 protein [Modestobacter sp. VKM Ac-2986]MCZ2830968.1 glycoside hydrolase family 6 protein [Modestobacter sp. VKM Ac-2986]